MNNNKLVIYFNKKKCKYDGTLMEAYKKMGIGNFLLGKTKHYGVLINLLKTKLRNEVLLRETIQLNIFCTQNKIKIVFLKGVVLAYQVYSKPEYRSSGDIDILIHERDLKLLIDYFNKENYKYNEQVVSLSNIEIADRTHGHINPVLKIVKTTHGEYRIEIEVHIKLFHGHGTFLGNKQLVKDMINNSTQICLLNNNISVLNSEDNLMYLMYHFSFHYIKSIRFSYEKYHSLSKAFVPLNLLHDIFLLLEKNDWNIEFFKLINKANKVGVVFSIAFSLELISEIYDKKFLKEYSKLIKAEYRPLNFQDEIMKTFSEIKPKKVVCGDVQCYMHNKIKSICFSVLDCEYGKVSNALIIDEYLDQSKIGIITHMDIGEKPYESKELNSQLNISWDYNQLHMSFLVQDNRLDFLPNNKNIYIQDCIILMLYLINNNRESFYRLHIMPDDAGSVKIVDVFGNNIDKKYFYAEFSKIDWDKYIIKVDFKWRYFKIKPSKRFTIKLNYAVNDCNLNEDNKQMFYLGNGVETWHPFHFINCIFSEKGGENCEKNKNSKNGQTV